MKLQKWYVFIFILFGIIAFGFFRIPEGHIIAGSDYYQLTNYVSLTERYLYAWINQIGQGTYNTLFVTYPFYFLLSLLNLIFPSNIIASWLIFLSLSLFFLSFTISSKMLLPELPLEKRLIASLFYAMNNFVISMFTYPWGFTHQYLIYIFFPLLVSAFTKVLIEETNNKSSVLIFFAIMLIATPAFNNAAFFVLLVFAQFITLLALFFVGLINVNTKTMLKLFSIAFIYIIVSSSYLIPFAEYTSIDISRLNTSNVLGGKNYLEPWVRNTSSNFVNSFLFAMDNYRHPFFENSHQFIFILLSSLSFIFFITLLTKSFRHLGKKNITNKLVVSFVFLYLFFVLLSIRLNSPFDFINKKIYLFPLFSAFRSSDKIFLTIPFFFSMAIAALLNKIRTKNDVFLLKLTLFLLSIPFFLQVIPQFLQGDYNRYAKRTVPEYSYIISIPKEYKDLKYIIDADNKNTAIVSLPYSIINSINWSNYPLWHLVGHDVLHTLYSKRFISANTFDNPQSENLFSFRDFNESDDDSSKLLKIIEKFGGEYIIAHKDIDKSWINKSERIYIALNDLSSKKQILKVKSNKFFDLYKLNSEFVQPIISSDKGEVIFQKINNSKYRLQIKSKDKVMLKFLQTYDPNWRLYVSNNNTFSKTCSKVQPYLDGRVKECENKKLFFEGDEFIFQRQQYQSISHAMCNEYANCWQLNGSNNSPIELVLYYKSQNYVYLQYGVYVAGIIIIFIYSLRKYVEKQKA